MSNYRGDDAGMSPDAAAAVRRIRAGDTPAARKRDLIQKIGMGVGGAALTGFAGYLKGNESKEQSARDERPTKEAKAGAKDYAYAQAKKNRSSAEAGLFAGVTPDLPDYKPMDSSDKARATLDDLKAIDAGDSAPVYGRDGNPMWPGKSFDMADMGAQMHGRDMNKARDIMSGADGTEEQGYQVFQNAPGKPDALAAQAAAYTGDSSLGAPPAQDELARQAAGYTGSSSPMGNGLGGSHGYRR